MSRFVFCFWLYIHKISSLVAKYSMDRAYASVERQIKEVIKLSEREWK